MPVHIGELIRIEYKKQGLNQKQLGVLINKHEKTIANIILRQSIDTQLLLDISRALHHDFFQYYYNEFPFKTFREEELFHVNNEIANLKKELVQKDEALLTNKKYIQSQEDVIRLLKEKEQFLNKN